MSQKAQLRKQLDEALITGSDQDAFVSDYFPEIHRRSSGDIDRQYKLTRLINEETFQNIQEALRNYLGNKKAKSESGSLIDESINRRRILIDLQSDMNVRLEGIAADQIVNCCWGTSIDDVGRRVDLQCNWRYRQQEMLSLSLMRLAIHGGVRNFEAENPQTWFEKHHEEAGNCLGVLDDHWRASAVQTKHPEKWWFSTIIKPAISTSIAQTVTTPIDGKSLADDLQITMDQWVLARLDAEVDRLIDGDYLLSLGCSYHSDYIAWMKHLWPCWKTLLISSPRLLRQVLICALTTADDTQSQGGPGLLRAGPRTVKTCLLPAFVFAMVIDAALGPLNGNMVPIQGQPPVNFQLLGEDAQLVGLQLINRQRLAAVLLQQTWPTSIVLLPHEQRRLRELPNSRRIGTPRNSLERLTMNPLDKTLITQDPTVLGLLAQPPTELRKYIVQELSEHDARIQRETYQVVERATRTKGQVNDRLL